TFGPSDLATPDIFADTRVALCGDDELRDQRSSVVARNFKLFHRSLWRTPFALNVISHPSQALNWPVVKFFLRLPSAGQADLPDEHANQSFDGGKLAVEIVSKLVRVALRATLS